MFIASEVLVFSETIQIFWHFAEEISIKKLKHNTSIMPVMTKSEIQMFEIISIYHGCMVWIEKSVTRVTDRHHEACRVMPISDPE